MEDSIELQQGNSKEERIARLQPHQWKKGQSGNPKGRPDGKSMKEYAKEMLNRMTDEEREEFFSGIDKLKMWEMAEGKADTNTNIKGDLSITGAALLNQIADEEDN